MKRIVIVSGHFNPLHGGHLDLFESAKLLGDKLLCIVSNDDQQLMKKGKIILDECDRLRLIEALSITDESMLSMDTETPYQIETLKYIRSLHKNDILMYVNGGDRDGSLIAPEMDACRELGIELVFGVGSDMIIKRDCSTRINMATGQEK